MLKYYVGEVCSTMEIYRVEVVPHLHAKEYSIIANPIPSYGEDDEFYEEQIYCENDELFNTKECALAAAQKKVEYQKNRLQKVVNKLSSEIKVVE